MDKDLLRRTVCKGMTADEVDVFVNICEKRGLDPHTKQIYAVKMGDKFSFQTSIDGLRLLADRTGNYAPGKDPEFEYDGDNVIACRAYVKKRTVDGTWHEVCASAYFDEYKGISNFWKTKPHIMLSKCAESLALRRAFPAEMSGLYSEDEMDQSKIERPFQDEKKEEMLSQDKIDILEEFCKEFPERKANYLRSRNISSFSELSEKEFVKLHEYLKNMEKKAS